MLVLKILLILLGVLIVLLLIPIRVIVFYRDAFQFRAVYLFLHYTYPNKKPQKKVKKEPSKKKEKKERKKSSLGGILKERGISGFVTLMKGITGISGKAIRFILRYSWVTSLKVTVVVGGEDAAQTAIHCGYYSAIVYPAVSWFTSLANVQKPQVGIYPDYDAKGTKADLQARGVLWPIILLWAAASAFFRYISLTVKRRVKKRIEQGGAEHE